MKFLSHGHPPGSAEEMEWPRSLVVGWSLLPLLTCLAILLQRHAIASPGRASVFVAVVALPWLLQALDVDVPSPLFGALVLGGTLGLFFRPVDNDIAPFPLVFLVAQMCAVCTTVETMFWALAAMGLMAGADLAGLYDQSLPWYFGIAFGWVGGFMVKSQLVLLGRLRAAQADLAERAATDERRRIARELHDVIAHSLTVMMLHVTGARRALERDTRDAAEALEEAERLGRQSLQDVRRVVGVLGPGSDRDHSPPPGAGDVAQLIDQFRGAGAIIRANVEGQLGSLEPTTGLALYRIIQESLTNAAKHASGSDVEVAIVVGTETTSLRVVNRMPDLTASSRTQGLGLWGMKERVTLLGGAFSAGAQNGRWIVEATLPSPRLAT